MHSIKNVHPFQLEISILNIEKFKVHREWRYKNVNSPFSRIYYITQGYGTIFHHGKNYALIPGNLYLIPAFTPVDMYCEDSFTHYYIHITTRMPNEVDLLSAVNCTYQVNAEENGINRQIFDRLLELNPGKELIEKNANFPIYRFVLERCVQLDNQKPLADIIEGNALINLLLVPCLRNSGIICNTISDPKYNTHRFQPVIKYIQENLAEPVTLTALAELVKLTPPYFSSVFSKLIGISPINYLNKKRVEKAQKLLLLSNANLQEISERVGFDDVFYFSRLFKKHVGVSPRKYRNEFRIV